MTLTIDEIELRAAQDEIMAHRQLIIKANNECRRAGHRDRIALANAECRRAVRAQRLLAAARRANK